MSATIPTPQSLQADIDRLAGLYELRDPTAVAGFVRRHPEVSGPLLEATRVVPRYFGRGTRLVLEVERDRDAPEHEHLFALIQTNQDVDAALASLDRFNTEWWLDALRPVATKVIFGLEYA